MEGSTEDVNNWLWCCDKARQRDSYTNRFIPGSEWGSMSGSEQQTWDSKGCNTVVGGASKFKCKLGGFLYLL